MPHCKRGAASGQCVRLFMFRRKALTTRLSHRKREQMLFWVPISRAVLAVSLRAVDVPVYLSKRTKQLDFLRLFEASPVLINSRTQALARAVGCTYSMHECAIGTATANVMGLFRNTPIHTHFPIAIERWVEPEKVFFFPTFFSTSRPTFNRKINGRD